MNIFSRSSPSLITHVKIFAERFGGAHTSLLHASENYFLPFVHKEIRALDGLAFSAFRF